MARTMVYQGRKIQLASDVRTNAQGQTIQRDIILHPGAVAILPLVDENHVCLLRNHRFILETDLWEAPAGTLEPGEPVEQAAVRELAEETGYQARQWRKLAEFYPSPGVLSELLHVFVASELTPGAMRPEPDEQLEPHVLPWDQVLAWALQGVIRDAKTLVAVLLWDRLRQQG